ncbi:MAG: helix-turn-helix domain-containing protein [bacterium]
MPSITEQLFQETKHYFVDLGYNELDCLVYILALQYGPVSMVTVARLANKARSTIYESIKRLVVRGVILEQPQRSTTLYTAISLDQFVASIETQSLNIASIADNIGKYKTSFDALKEGNTQAPIVTLY